LESQSWLRWLKWLKGGNEGEAGEGHRSRGGQRRDREGSAGVRGRLSLRDKRYNHDDHQHLDSPETRFSPPAASCCCCSSRFHPPSLQLCSHTHTHTTRTMQLNPDLTPPLSPSPSMHPRTPSRPVSSLSSLYPPRSLAALHGTAHRDTAPPLQTPPCHAPRPCFSPWNPCLPSRFKDHPEHLRSSPCTFHNPLSSSSTTAHACSHTLHLRPAALGQRVVLLLLLTLLGRARTRRRRLALALRRR
jgi:hypothetical protein